MCASVCVLVSVCFGLPGPSVAAGEGQVGHGDSEWILDAGVGYGMMVGVSDINSSSRTNIGTPSYGLEIAHQFGAGHRLGVRGDLMARRGGPGAYHEVMARQVGGFYGWGLEVGEVRLTADAGIGVGDDLVSQSDVTASTTLHPRLFGNLGVSWQPLSFLGVGVDVVASGIGTTSVSGLGSLELSSP
jgi:hypothetical protein